jgi:O-antigen/teichoic acid export membrane protein
LAPTDQVVARAFPFQQLMSRSQRVLQGTLITYANQFLIIVVGLWLTPFMLRRVGKYDYGLWLIATQLLAYLQLCDLGVIGLVPRATAYAIGRAGAWEQATDLPEVIGHTVLLVLWQTVLVALAAAAIWLFLPADWEPLAPALGMVLLVFVATYPLRIFQAILNGLQDLGFLAGVQSCSWLVGTLTLVILVFAGMGLGALAAGWAVTQLTASSLFGYRLWRRFPGVLPSRLPAFQWGIARDHLTRAIWISMPQVAGALLNGTDLFVIGKVFGPAIVVTYACTGKLVAVLSNQPQVLMQVVAPALSEMSVSRDRHRLSSVCTALSQAILMATGTVVCLVLVLNKGFVNWWVGAEEYAGFQVTALLLVNMLLRHWNTTLVYTLFSFGYDRQYSITITLDALLSACCLATLPRWMGIVGVPMALIIGVSLVSLPANLTVVAKETGTSVWALLGLLLPLGWRCVLLCAGGIMLSTLWVPDSLVALVATAFIVSLACIGMLLPIALRPPLRSYVVPLIVRLSSRFNREATKGYLQETGRTGPSGVPECDDPGQPVSLAEGASS